MSTSDSGQDTNDLVRDHLDLVGRTVAKVSARYPRHVDREELWNAGALGLVEAARRFNPESGIPLRTVCSHSDPWRNHRFDKDPRLGFTIGTSPLSRDGRDQRVAS